ncbi:BMC domain-containing protein [Veillonella sp. CHU110]|uniref:BMC domain-containing protein n=1 Tax=Veillonella sp. CHU110 TaxID=2490947 RepID=UPI000F8EF188|nr:BMC domain-containing protein [Veillonella sp. CHU110]
MNQSLGLLEVKGLLGAITMSDVMVKASNVHVVNIDRANGFGWFTVKVVGDVGAVQSAVEAGAMVAKKMGCFVSSKVIPRVSQTVIDVFLQEETAPAKEEPIAEVVEEATVEPAPVEETPSVPVTGEVDPAVETVIVEPAETTEATIAEAISELTNIVIGEESTPSITEVAPKATGSKKSTKSTKTKKKSSSKK